MNALLQSIAAGQTLYSETPLWEEQKSYGEVKVDGKIVSISNSKFGNSLAINTGAGVCYIKLRSTAAADKTAYTVADFAATRDSADYGVHAGDVKRMAY